MRSHDRQVIVRLRHELQTCESTQRQAWRALGTFQEHLIAAGQETPILHLAELAGEISAIRLVLDGAGEVDHG
jgi:hypothetical protein